MIYRIGLGLALAAFASGVSAAPTEVGELQVGEATFSLPVPEGYCGPKGPSAAWAQLLAAADTENVTLATLLACERTPAVEPTSDYLLIKAPRGALILTVEKDAGLAAIDQTVNGDGAVRFDPEMQAKVERDFNAVTGAGADFSGNIGGAGRDEDCVYLTGTIVVTRNEAKAASVLATCVTVAGGKVVTVNAYGKLGTVTIPTLKERARNVAMTLTPE